MRVAPSAQPQNYASAMLVKIKQTQEIQGEAALKLIEGAALPNAAVKPRGTGRLVDTVA